MDVEEPLDFEFEDPLATPEQNPKTKRGKFIGLDDLLTEYYKEKEETILADKRAKKLKWRKYDSDEDEDNSRNEKEMELFKLVDNCRNQVNEMVTEDDIQPWGLSVFGQRKQHSITDTVNLQNCKFMQYFLRNKDSLPFQLNTEGCFFEGLLVNGWRIKLVFAQGYLEECIASWTFHQMLYSTDEKIHSLACNFWCEILLSNEVDTSIVKCNWFEFSKLKGSLEIYGYLFNIADNLPLLNLDHPGNIGPSPNIRSWLRFVAALCQSRVWNSVLSNIEFEELLSIVVSFFLDRQLQGLSSLLDECLRSIVSSFAEEQWLVSCRKVAKSFANRIPKDLNCLRIVESISLTSSRCKSLRSELASQLLIHCFEKQVNGANEVLCFLTSVNLKDKKCDFIKLYIYSVLVENWLYVNPGANDKPILQLWHKYLRNCSSQITSTDWRPFASKVRNRASYLMQSTNSAKY